MMRTQKDWISFKTKFRGVAIRKGFRPALAGPRPSEEALMVPDPSDATGRSQVPETPNQIAARLAQWDTANSLCWEEKEANKAFMAEVKDKLKAIGFESDSE